MSVLRSAFLISVFSLVAYADSDCRISYKFSNRSGDSALFGQQPVVRPPNTSPQYDNRLAGCTGWALNYDNEGFSALSIQLEDAPTSSTNGTAGTFEAFAGTGVSGSNPNTATTSGSYTGTGYYPYLRVNVSSVTGTGSINVTLNGWKSPNYIASLGGGGGGGSGTVTSVATTGPITGGTFTTSGTIACATCLVSVAGAPSATQLSFLDATSSIQTQLNTKGTGNGNGTVTSIATSSPLGGGTITGTGTLTCATCGVTGSPLSQFASTTSAQLLATLSDASGTGAAVFANTPTLVTPNLGAANSTSINVGTAGLRAFSSGFGTQSMLIGTSAGVVAGYHANISTYGSANTDASAVSMVINATNNKIDFGSGVNINWASIATGSSSGLNAGSLDSGLGRNAAGIIEINNGSACSTAANCRFIKHAGTLVGGTTFTATGLSVGTLVGGATAGTFTLGANGAGTVVVTMGNSATAPTGWACSASDRTTLTALVDQSASSTTTATINFPAGALSGDVVSFYCVGY